MRRTDTEILLRSRVLDHSARKKMADFVQHEVPQVQNFVKSGNQFLRTARSFIVKSVREGKLTRDRGRAYFKEVVEIMGTNVNEVLECLMDLNDQMAVDFTDDNSSKCGNAFVSTVISSCYFYNVIVREKTNNYFGASLSCKGRQQKEIMIDILCCQTWHRDISLAVCVGNWFNKQAFRFPPKVQSMAFKINPPGVGSTPGSRYDRPSRVQMSSSLERSRPPLKQRISLIHRELYGIWYDMLTDVNYDPIPVSHKHLYYEFGNCAECESLSQLLCANQPIAERLEYTNFLTEPTNRSGLINLKHERLEENLKLLGFNGGRHLEFYDPSV
ncbi:uncharacterized protein LOC121293643 isoform X2 [Carcharodon carcharias]|uniref:uncharacterized protein LOC121293643 isoform X2 n=1 Tax=Carcharodon carcharias TaxID=13397 RepID=UPI001B7F606A|nr:uncharacterized protein LOC121293643 isoform X2 [Carcharodon carcharias]